MNAQQLFIQVFYFLCALTAYLLFVYYTDITQVDGKIHSSVTKSFEKYRNSIMWNQDSHLDLQTGHKKTFQNKFNKQMRPTSPSAISKDSYNAHPCGRDLHNDVVVPEECTFQAVVIKETWIMSAHVDIRTTNTLLVRVYGVSSLMVEPRRGLQHTLYCQLWNKDTDLVAVSNSSMMMVNRLGFMIEGFQLECLFSLDVYSHYNSLFISVVSSPCEVPHNIMKITDNRRTHKDIVKYTVCISGPTKYNYSDHQRFIEWMELNRILGVGRTIVYNADASPIMNKVFEFYKKKSWLFVYNVKPPYIYGDDNWIKRLKRRKEGPSYSKMIMMLDCVMREMFRTKYVAFMDIDENIIPREHGDYTWDDMLTSSGCSNSDYIMARHVFFRRDWGIDPKIAHNVKITDTYRLLSLTTTRRDDMFWLPTSRSKYMVKPESVRAPSTHWAKMHDRSGPCVLNTTHGALQHYKYFKNDIRNNTYTRDRTTYKYKTHLERKVSQVYSELREDMAKYGITLK